MILIRALHVAALTAFRRDSAAAERSGIGTQVDGTVRGKYGSGLKGVLDPASHSPARDVHGDRVRIEQLDEFLILIARCRIEVDCPEVDYRLRGCGLGKRDFAATTD